MKFYPVLALYLFFKLAIAQAQVPDYQGVLVCDFSVAAGISNDLGRTLSGALEIAFLEQNCRVVPRQEHASLMANLYRPDSVAIPDVIPDTLRTALGNAGIRILAFGRVFPGIADSVAVTLCILELQNDQEPRTVTLVFSKAEIQDAARRRDRFRQWLFGPGNTVPGTVLVTTQPPLDDTRELTLYQAFAERPNNKNTRTYLAHYPNGQYLPLVESRLWGECMVVRSQSKCKRYLRFFSTGVHAEEARKILTEPPAFTEEYAVRYPPLGTVSQIYPYVHYWDVEFICGKKARLIRVSTGLHVPLEKQFGGTREGRARLKDGAYTVKVYTRTGRLLCTRSVYVKSNMVVELPCGRW